MHNLWCVCCPRASAWLLSRSKALHVASTPRGSICCWRCRRQDLLVHVTDSAAVVACRVLCTSLWGRRTALESLWVNHKQSTFFSTHIAGSWAGTHALPSTSQFSSCSTCSGTAGKTQMLAPAIDHCDIRCSGRKLFSHSINAVYCRIGVSAHRGAAATRSGLCSRAHTQATCRSINQA